MNNFLCVKWGSKYSSDYVNKLYNMVEVNSNDEFKFYCYTDDSSNLNNNIVPIPIQSDLTGWWLKLDLLNLFQTGTNILFDLDIVIINKLSRLESVKTRTLSVLYSQWKEGYITPSEKYPTLYNSSIMKWENTQGKAVYDYFLKHKDYILFKYVGIDRFLFNEPVEVDLLPTSIAYSYWKGVRFKKDTTPQKLRTSYEVCILNHGQKQEEIDGWIHNFWK